MVDPELSRRLSSCGHYYQDVRVTTGAKAHLGNTYNINQESPLSLLPFVAAAPFNSYDRQLEPTCLPNTRADLLRKIYDWADRQDQPYIFWLNGWAGIGKSTVARTVARTYFEQKRLGATFFSTKGGGDLASNIPSLEQHVCKVIMECKGIASQSLADQWRQPILGPLSKLDGINHQSSYLLIIDALDECEEDDNILQIILQLIAEARSLKNVQLQMFLTSRPEVPIRYGMYEIPQDDYQDFILHNVPSASIDHDISLFLQHSLGRIKQRQTGWPGQQALQQLVSSASGLFIWAATACRFIQEGKKFADGRLNTVLEGSSDVAGAPEKHLDEIYITVLKHSISPYYTEKEKEESYSTFKLSIGSIVVLLSPLSMLPLSKLLQLSYEKMDETLDDLHSILDVPEDQNRPLRLHHPSFRDFLLDKKRCDTNFWVDEQQAHRTLAARCIRFMSDSLKQDVCGLKAPGTRVVNVEGRQIEGSLPSEIQYACLYWVQHLKKSSDRLYNQVCDFLKEHFLHWLEALGWIEKTSEGILAMISLEALIPADIKPDLYSFVHDGKRFAQYNRSVIELAPLQLYCSSLIFAPQKSIVRRHFEKDIPSWILRKPKVQPNWNAALQTLEGHISAVSFVAFSPDGKQVVSGSWDGTVRLWDATTGAALQTLEGLDRTVSSVTSSPDGKVNTLSVSNSWIIDGQVDIIWLPPDYRETSTAFWDRSIALGHASGKVSLLQVI